jgi:DNA-binding NarL/FixJ family response regulator
VAVESAAASAYTDLAAWEKGGPQLALRQTEACGPLLVVDDDAGLRAFVREILLHAGYSTFETDSGRDVVELVRRERPALVILDVQLPVLSGYELCRLIRDEGPTPPILVISGERIDGLDRVAGLLLGADDYLVKPFSADELLARIRSLLRRSENGNSAQLTRRELAVIRLLAEGLAHREIGRRLVISPKTVGTHVEHIYEKLGAHNRTEALAAAYRLRVIAPP